MPRLALVSVLLVGCAVNPADDLSSTSTGPLVGVDGSHDQADRNCHVVLRGMARNSIGVGYETVGSSWVWQGTVEISEAAANEGLVPSVLYQSGSDPTWFRVDGQPVSIAATPGYVRFAVRLDHDLPGPGMSGTSLSHTRIKVVPFLQLPGGGRLFDHNRNPSDFDNYTITSPELAIGHDDTICTPPAGPTHANLVFGADWSEHREGILAPGGELTIVYADARLPTCRNSQGGNPLYDITAHVQFEPGAQRRDVSVRSGTATLSVPSDARGVTLWFENTSSSGCQAWDSNMGANYWFDALVPPQWIGNAQTLITRDGSDPCDGGGSLASIWRFDTWARQRAGISNLCFEVYQPGLTDRDDPDLWQKLDVNLVWRYTGQTTWTTTPVGFDRRVGNNARYAFTWRTLDPFRTYHCPDVAPTPTADGQYTQLDVEYYLTVNGGQLRPAPGAAFAGSYLDYLNDSWRAQNCH